MKAHHVKIVVILLLSSLLVTYTNCGKPFAPPSELTFKTGAVSGDAVSAFEQTVYPITRSYCVSCHSSIQPMHAADDVTTAYKAVMENYKVNMANIPASRLVAKLRDDHHNCWSDCAENAQEMQTAIETMASMMEETGTGEPAPVDTAIYTAETDTLQMELADPTNPLKTNSVKLNIEAAMLQAPMELVRPQDVEAYLAVNSTGQNLAIDSATAGRAFFNFTVPASGSYRIWSLVHAPSTDDNQAYIRVYNTITNANIVATRNWDITVGTRFEWRQVPNVAMNLTANTQYTLDLRQREDGVRIAGFIITSDTSFNGQEVGDYFGVTLAFDMSQRLNSPGARFLIDVVDYDSYSYKFSRPRFESGNANIYVKGIKVYVNNSFNAQHSTYSIVDKIVSPTDSSLSTYSMIVLKDRGTENDRIKFSFDQLTVTTNGGNTGADGGATGGANSQTSLMAFQATVYPISRSSTYSCVGCHMTVSPRHSSDNTLTAHDAALTVVDFNNPQNSRIVNKMRVERHNCGANCDQIADLYQNAIIEWRTRRQ